MTEQETVDNAHILDGFTIHNTVDSDGEIGVLLEGIKDGKDPVTILTTFKILQGAVAAIKQELEKKDE
jgi:hypothetical protein